MTNRKTAVIVLAAGMGTRMKSARPKVMHPLAGQPMIARLTATIAGLKPEKTVVVIAPGMDEAVKAVAPHLTVVQKQRLGTGHAVKTALTALGNFTGDVLILYGDTPLLSASAMKKLIAKRRSRHDPAAVLLGFRPDDPGAYGRIIAGADPKDPTCVNEPAPNYEQALAGRVKGLKIGVPANHYYDGATGDVRKRMEESLAVFKTLGARIIEIKVPDPQEIFLLSATVSQSEAATMHGPWIRTRPQDYSLYVLSRMEAGFHIPVTTYLQAINLRAHLLDDFMRQVYMKVDLLHTPVMVMPPPTIAETEPRASGDVTGIVSRITRNTRPTNYLGLPALSVPAGFSDNGLPIAFQLMGRPFSEALIFRAAHLYQQDTDWHTRVPAL